MNQYRITLADILAGEIENDGSAREKDQSRRHRIVSVMLAFLVVVGVVAAATIRIPVLWVSVAMVTVGLIAFLFMNHRRLFQSRLMFLPVALSSIVAVSLTGFDPGIPVLSVTFFAVILAVIYMHPPLFYFALSVGLFIHIYIFLHQEQLSIPLQDLPKYGATFIIVNGLLGAVMFMNRSLIADLEKEREQSTLLTDQLQKSRAQLIASVESASFELSGIARAADENTKSLEEMNQTIKEIAGGSVAQANSTLQISEALDNLDHIVGQVTASRSMFADKMAQTAALSAQGIARMNELSSAINALQGEIETVKASTSRLIEMLEETESFSETIEEIAEQTQMLALNASIEAARAGEFGLGLSVVAQAIRRLAVSTANSAIQISNHLRMFSTESGETQAKMHQAVVRMKIGNRIARETMSSFDLITGAVNELNGLSGGFSNLIDQLHLSSSAIKDEANRLSSVAEETAASMEEVTATLGQLTGNNRLSLEGTKKVEEELKGLTAG